MLSIEVEIEKLQSITEKIESEFSIELLTDATTEIDALFKRINDLTRGLARRDQKSSEELEELEAFIKSIDDIVNTLKEISQGKIDDAPEPDKVMHDFAESFDAFISHYMSKRNQENLNNLLQYVPVVKDIVFYAETIPYYWHHATTQEKIGMVLSVAITAAAIAICIASVCSPAIAALPISGIPMLTLLGCGRSLFNSIIDNPKKQCYEFEQTKKNKETLDEISMVISKSFESRLKSAADLPLADSNSASNKLPTEQSEDTPRSLTPAANKKLSEAVDTVHDCADKYFGKEGLGDKNMDDPKRLKTGWGSF